jgi:transposase
VGSGRRVRRWRSIYEKLKIVHQVFPTGVSIAQVARTHGVNANQVFTCRRASERGGLRKPCGADPVTVSNRKEERRDSEAVAASRRGALQIELPRRALIRLESGADPGSAVFDSGEASSVIQLPVSTKAWIEARMMDLPFGFDGLWASSKLLSE